MLGLIIVYLKARQYEFSSMQQLLTYKDQNFKLMLARLVVVQLFLTVLHLYSL